MRYCWYYIRLYLEDLKENKKIKNALQRTKTPQHIFPRGRGNCTQVRSAFVSDYLGLIFDHRHYQDSYASLIIMFGSALMLPPRTKRWAEAKVLADCINLKVRKADLPSQCI